MSNFGRESSLFITSSQEWFYNSIVPGVHFEEIFKFGPDGTRNYTDALSLVERLKANDTHARQTANNALEFAQTYLIKEVMLKYLVELLIAYKDLFSDMDEYMSSVGDPGYPELFVAQAMSWEKDWRTIRVPPPPPPVSLPLNVTGNLTDSQLQSGTEQGGSLGVGSRLGDSLTDLQADRERELESRGLERGGLLVTT